MEHGTPKIQPNLASAVGGALLILIAVILWTVACVPSSADAALKILVALGAGLLGGGITGQLKVKIAPSQEGKGIPSGPASLLARWKIEAVGGAAVSLLVGAVLFNYPTKPSPRCMAKQKQLLQKNGVRTRGKAPTPKKP